MPIDVGQATAVGSVLLAVLFLVKVFAVAKYSLTTTTGLIAAAPLQLLLGTIAMYAYPVMPALAFGVAWLGVTWWRDPDRSRFPVATWPVVAAVVVLTALLSPTEFFVAGATLVAVCLRAELGLRTTRPGWTVAAARWLLLALAAGGVAYLYLPVEKDLALPCLIFATATAAVDTLLRTMATAGRTWWMEGARRLRGRTFLVLGTAAAMAYLIYTVEVPWMPAQIFVASYPVEISTQDKSIENRKLSEVRATVLEAYPLAKDEHELTVLEADTRRIVRLPRDMVGAQPACHRDREQLPGKAPLLLTLRGIRYNSHNITCETLRESLLPARGLAYRPGDGLLVTAGWDGAFALWDPTGYSLGAVPAPRPTVRVETRSEAAQVPFPLSLASDGDELATAGPDGRVRLWDTTPGGERLTAPTQILPAAKTFTGRPTAVSALAFNRHGDLLAVAAGDRIQLYARGARTFKKSGTLIPAAGVRVNAVAFAEDEKLTRLLAGGGDGRMTVWDPARPHSRPLGGWPVNDNEVYALAVAPDGRTVAAAGGRREIARERFSEPYEPDASIWLGDYTKGSKPTRRLPASRNNGGEGHGGAVNALAFSRDNQQLASGGSDGTIRLWDFAGRTDASTVLHGHTGGVNGLAFWDNAAGCGKAALASTGTDQTVRLWRSDEGRLTTKEVLSPPGPQPSDGHGPGDQGQDPDGYVRVHTPGGSGR